MKILWFTWKDLEHPLAGGAEVVNEELAKRLAATGHDVTFVVAGFPGGAPDVGRHGFHIIRVGSRYTSYLAAFFYYRKHLRGWADIVIDECNTMPFFTRFYVREPSIMFFHMLCRKIWFYEFPPVLSHIGYVLEPAYLWLLRRSHAITVSESTNRDLLRVGFRRENLHRISEGIELTPLPALSSVTKYEVPTLLSLGSIRPMKRTMDQLRAFELAKPHVPGLRLIIAGAGEGAYGRRVAEAAGASQYATDITVMGRVTPEQKLELMQRCHLIMVTSVKEGWGLIVTEAASQGTPAVVYDVDGLRDSVRHNATGLIAAKNTPQALAEAAVSLLLDPARYQTVRAAAWEWSKTITFDRSYADLVAVIAGRLQAPQPGPNLLS